MVSADIIYWANLQFTMLNVAYGDRQSEHVNSLLELALNLSYIQNDDYLFSLSHCPKLR